MFIVLFNFKLKNYFIFENVDDIVFYIFLYSCIKHQSSSKPNHHSLEVVMKINNILRYLIQCNMICKCL